MNFQLNHNLGNWLAGLNGKTVSNIYQVNYNENRKEDHCLPWLCMITFTDHDQFLQIEGDFDGDHIKIDLFEMGVLENRLREYNLTNV
ncbi:hypothetical protein U0035_14165 [Niabella yanshanensis]|uniref:Uncharacterized protein n=1 Tax=Niabella yanshanensis TaxID=577386 RepID=A0ABZ0W0N6_9BACT|nr:hypothetical protein [Niabella yanshanensis]WQD36813.1 hypothetical protein U0035_14165 [Niabella yanshanensis]